MESRRRIQNNLRFVLLSGPALGLYALVMAWPVVNMFIVSTKRWKGVTRPSTAIGWANYTRMFSDPRFLDALKNTGIYLAISLPLILILSFMLGFFLSLRMPGSRILRTIFFTPTILSVSAMSMIFLGLYLPEGIVNQFLRGVGLSGLERVWLADCSTALGSIIAIDVWSAVGFYAVLFYAAFATIPQDFFDAAMLDGARGWQIMWRIVFPMNLDFFGVLAMLSFLWTLGSSQLVLILTKGGPGTCSLTLGYLLYEQAFRYRDLGYSQAIGVFIFFVGVISMVAIRMATNRRYE